MESMYMTCVQCKKKTNIEVGLQPYWISNKLVVFLCPSEMCLFPLNVQKLHKFVFKRDSPESELQMCDPSEVPKMLDIYKILVKTRESEKPSKPEMLTGALPESKELTPVPVVTADSGPVNQDFEEGTNIQIEKKQSSQFVMWKNKRELCWLRPTLCLLVHNKTFQHYFKSENFGNCHVKKFSEAYIKAASSLNLSKLSRKSSVLTHSIPLSYFKKVLEMTFDYLQPYMLCEIYKEETPVMPVVLLLKENMNLHNLFLSEFTVELKCDNCGRQEASQNKKTFVFIPGTVQKNENNCVICNSQCSQCRSEGQKMTLQFHDFSPFLLMHFIEGLPSNDLASMDFLHGGQMYGVRGFVQHNQSNQRFVPWIRCDKEGKQWKCCDDLDPLLRNLTTQLPAIPASEIHIVMWEQRETSNEMDFSWLCNSWADIYKIHISESTNPTLITLGDSDSEDCKTIFVDQESSAASPKLGVCANTDFNKNSSPLCPEILNTVDSYSNNPTDKGSVPYGPLCTTSEWNIGEEIYGCLMNVSPTSEQKDSTFQGENSKLSSSKEVCLSSDESQILGKEDSTKNNYMANSVADCSENLNVQETKKQTHNTPCVRSSGKSPSMAACNAQFQNTKEEILQPSKNLSNNKSVLEDCIKAVVEMKVSNADEKSEFTICDVSSNSKNEAGVGESKNWNSSMDFESVVRDVEGCTDTETNTNDRLSTGGNIDSLSQAVKGMSKSEHETSKTSKRKTALHFQTTQYSELSFDTSHFGKILECHVIADKLDVEMFAKKRSLGRKDADKEDSCSQSTSSLPKTSVKAQNHNDSRKTTFPVGGNAVERAPSGEPNNVSIGVVMSPLLHNMPFKKTVRKQTNLASGKSPSTEQAEASLVSGPVFGQNSYVEEPNTGTIIHTGQVYHRIINRYESEHKRTRENTLQTDSNTQVTSDAFTSSIITEDQSVANSVKENASVHPEAVLNDTSLTQLDSLLADFELKKSSYKVISPMSSDSSFTTPSADDSASPRNRKNSPAAVIQHAEDLKTQQPNNLGIPSLKDAETERKVDSLRQMCRSAVSSSVIDHEENKDGTQLAASDLQKTLKNGDPSNNTLVEFLGDISASKDLYQVTDQNLDLSVNNTASSDKDIKNSHTVTDKGRSFCSSELTFPKHSNLNIKKPCAKIIGQRKMNKKKPCAKVIGQRKTLENVTTIPKQVAMNENETSEIKVMSLKSKPDKTLQLDVSHGRCFQSKPVVDDSRHLPKATQGKSVNDKDIEPNSIKFVEFPVDTQLSVPECCIKDGGLSVNGYSSCRNETSLNSNEVLLRVTEAKSPKLFSGDTGIKSKYFAQSMCNAKKQAESKSLKKTGEVSHNAEENVLRFQDIVAVFRRIPENVISENAIRVSEVPCRSRKSKGPAVKKCINKNSTTQVRLSTSSVDLKTCNKPVKFAPQTASKRQRKSACSNEATEQSATSDYRKQQDAARSEQDPRDTEFYRGLKTMIIGQSAQDRVLNESQSSGSSPEKQLGMVKNHDESVSVCASASQDSTIGQKSRGRKRKCLKNEVQNEEKFPSLPENSDQSGTTEGIASENKMRLRKKTVRFKMYESEKCLSYEGIKAAACSQAKTVSQPDIPEDQNGTTQRENHFEELNNSFSSGDNSVFSQTGNGQPAEGKSAETKGNSLKVTKKRRASILGAQNERHSSILGVRKKRQSGKHLSPQPMVKNHDESVSVCASASQNSTIGQKSRGRKRKCLKNEVQNEEKFPSLPENSDQSGTTKGIASENKMRLRKKTERFKMYKSQKCLSCEGIKAAACSQSKTVSQPDIPDDQNGTTQRENHFEELNNSFSSGDNSVFSQTGNGQPAEGKSAETKGNSLKVTKKRHASILGAQNERHSSILGVRKKRQSGKHLSPQPIVPIKRKSKNTDDAVNMNAVPQVQPSKSSAETQSENQCAASNSDISSEEKKCISPKTFPLFPRIPLEYLPQDLSMNFQSLNLIPQCQVSSFKCDE